MNRLEATNRQTAIPTASSLQRADLQIVADTAGLWGRIGMRLFEKAGDNQLPFLDSMSICGNIRCDIESFPHIINEDEPWDTAYLCRDAAGSIQALALHDKKKNKLAYIASNPFNIEHPVNREIKKVRGAASSIIAQLAKESLQAAPVLPLRVNTIKSSKPFYEKLQFEPSPEDRIENICVTSLKLSPENMQPLIDEMQKKYPGFTIERIYGSEKMGKVPARTYRPLLFRHGELSRS